MYQVLITGELRPFVLFRDGEYINAFRTMAAARYAVTLGVAPAGA